MRPVTLLFAFAIFIVSVSARIDPKNLKCLGVYIYIELFKTHFFIDLLVNWSYLVISVCRTTFEELNDVIKKVDKWKKVDVSNTFYWLKFSFKFYYSWILKFTAYYWMTASSLLIYSSLNTMPIYCMAITCRFNYKWQPNLINCSADKTTIICEEGLN